MVVTGDADVVAEHETTTRCNDACDNDIKCDFGFVL